MQGLNLKGQNMSQKPFNAEKRFSNTELDGATLWYVIRLREANNENNEDSFPKILRHASLLKCTLI